MDILSKYGVENTTIGFESLIKPQLDDWFSVFLLDWVNKVRGKIKSSKKMEDTFKELEDNIEKRFGIPVKCRLANLDDFGTITIGVLADSLDKGLVPGEVIKEWSKGDKTIKYVMEMYKELKKLNLEIDFDKAVIKGLKKDMKSLLFIGKNLFNAPTVSAEEYVAIILHEIGHMFTFIEVQGRAVRNTTELLEAIILYKSGKPDKAMKNVYKITNSKPDDDKVNVMYNLINKFNNSILPVTQQLGNPEGMFSDSEVLADSFAVKFGFGKYLATALSDFYKSYNFKREYLKLIFNNLIKLIGSVLLASSVGITIISGFGQIVIGALLIIFLDMVFLMLTANTYRTYDKLHERLEKMKLEMIRMLRTYNLDKKYVKKIISDIEDVDFIVKKVFEERSFRGFILAASNILNMGLELNNEKQVKLLIRKLIDNDLHYLSAKLEVGNEEFVYKLPDNRIYEILNDEDKNSVSEKLNNVLKDLGVAIDFEDRQIITEEYIVLNSGYFSIALTNKETNEVIIITVDGMKNKWLSMNPYIKLLDVIKIPINEIKNIYIIRTEKLNTFQTLSKEEKEELNKVISEIESIRNKIFDDFGSLRIDKMLPMFINYIEEKDLPSEIKDQFEVLLEMTKTLNLTEDDDVVLDIHGGNFAINRDNKIVILDPVYNRREYGKLVPNDY